MTPPSAALPRAAALPEIPDLREVLPRRENIYQILFPKGGRTFSLPNGAKDRELWKLMGFEIDFQLTPDFYRLRDTRGVLSGNNVQIWVNERKPGDIVSRLAMAIPESGWSMGNIGIAGNDTIDEFEQQRKSGKFEGQFAKIPLEKIMNTQLSRGAVCLLVPEEFNIRSRTELEGVDITAKYIEIAKSFAKKLKKDRGVSVRFVREAKGGTEDDLLLAGKRPTGNPYAFGDIDFVQSGKSAVERKLRVAFMDNAKWDAIKRGEQRFDDMSLDEMRREKGVLFTSSGYLIRPAQRFTQPQEDVNSEIVVRFQQMIEGMGRTPQLYPAAQRKGPEAYRTQGKPTGYVEGYGRPTY